MKGKRSSFEDEAVVEDPLMRLEEAEVATDEDDMLSISFEGLDDGLGI